MVLTIIEAQLLINNSNNLNINQKNHMAAPINYVLRQFEGNINTGDPTGIKTLSSSNKLDIQGS